MALALIAPRWRVVRAKLTRADWWALVWLSLAGNIVYYIFLATAVQMAGPAPAALIVGLLPVAISLIGTREEGAVSAIKLAPSLVLAVAGVALISASSLARDGLSGNLAKPGHWTDLRGGRLGLLDLFCGCNARCIARLPHVSSHDWSLCWAW